MADRSDSRDGTSSSVSSSVEHSKSTTPATTPPSSPVFKPLDGPLAQKIANSNLPPLDREYPKPEGEIDVEAALERTPKRWSITGQREANRRRAEQHEDEEATKAKRKADLEAIKKKLLASKDTLPLRPAAKH